MNEVGFRFPGLTFGGNLSAKLSLAAGTVFGQKLQEKEGESEVPPPSPSSPSLGPKGTYGQKVLEGTHGQKVLVGSDA